MSDNVYCQISIYQDLGGKCDLDIILILENLPSLQNIL